MSLFSSRKRAIGKAAAVVDRAATRLVNWRGSSASAALRHGSHAEPHSGAGLRGVKLAELEQSATAYRALAASGELFAQPRRIVPWERALPAGPHGARVTDLAWPSPHACRLDVLAPSYRCAHNEVAAARQYRAGAPRPVAILVHGYLGGRFALEQRILPVRALLEWGLDVVVVALPFHGTRRSPAHSGAPRFPSSDPRFAVEGFLHITRDLRDLVAWLRERGHPGVGVMGMSLGGYTAALLATLEPALEFVVPIIPLASLSDFMAEQGQLSANPALAQAQRLALDGVYDVISPLARPALVSPRRVVVIAGKQDHITPVSHARRLAHHFRAPLEVWAGGHVLQWGRGRAFARVGELFSELGLR